MTMEIIQYLYLKKINNMLGYIKGEICNRNNCQGIIDEHEKEGSCCCHIHPPCSYCVEDNNYCPECGWEGYDEQNKNTSKSSDNSWYEIWLKNVENRKKEIIDMYNGVVKITKFDYIIDETWNSGQRLKGVYTKDMTKQDILKKLSLSENPNMPRFSLFEDGRFKLSYFTD